MLAELAVCAVAQFRRCSFPSIGVRNFCLVRPSGDLYAVFTRESERLTRMYVHEPARSRSNDLCVGPKRGCHCHTHTRSLNLGPRLEKSRDRKIVWPQRRFFLGTRHDMRQDPSRCILQCPYSDRRCLIGPFVVAATSLTPKAWSIDLDFLSLHVCSGCS